MRLSRKNKKVLAIFKRRRVFTRSQRPLIWGTSGVRCLSRIMLPRRRLQWIKTWIKWHYKSALRRHRYNRYRMHHKRDTKYYWMRMRHVLPCTRKASKARMGKGKGEIKGWFGNMRAGFFILEFNWTKFYVMRRLFTYLTKKFTGRVQGVFKQNTRTSALASARGLYCEHYSRRELLTYRRFRRAPVKSLTVSIKRDVEVLN